MPERFAADSEDSSLPAPKRSALVGRVSGNVLEKTDDSGYGEFGWVMDPEGNKVELWQPPEFPVERSSGYCVSRMTKSPPGDVALSNASSFSRVGAASPRSYRA
jgi:hypothetical protein